jgi:hypothetical protein
MPEKDNHWLLRMGSGGALLGAVLAGVGNLLHPITPRDDPPGVARIIAGSDSWTLIHLTIVIGIILMPPGLLALRHSIPGNGVPFVLFGLAVPGPTRGGSDGWRSTPGSDRSSQASSRRYRQADSGIADPDHDRPDGDHAVAGGDRGPLVVPIRQRPGGLRCYRADR